MLEIVDCNGSNLTCDLRCEENCNGLSKEDADKINALLGKGGLCILPSDSSYVLTGLLNIPGISEDIDTLLERKGMKMSLAFGSLGQARKKMSLSQMACAFIKTLAPSGLTFVASPRDAMLRHFSINRLHADGTIGVRLTRSPVETQIARRFELPSTPIRNAEKGVISADEALQIVTDCMQDKKIRREIALVDGVVPYPGQWSTVVKEEKRDGLWYLRVIREGAIPIDRIKQVAGLCFYASVEC